MLTFFLMEVVLPAEVYVRVLPDSKKTGPGLAAEGRPIIKATLKKLKGTLDFNIVLILG